MTTTPNHEPLSLERAEDVLAYIPHALGFHPQSSAVLLLLVEHKLEATLRVDLPTVDDPHTVERWVDQVYGLIERLPQVTSTVCVLYVNQRAQGASSLPYQPLMQQLNQCLEEHRVPLRQAWCVNDTSGWDYSLPMVDRGHFDVVQPELNDTYLRMIVAGSAPMSRPWDGQGVPKWENAAQIRTLIEELDGDLLDSLDSWALVLDSHPQQAELLIREDLHLTARLLWGIRTRIVRDVLPFMAGVGTLATVEVVTLLASGHEGHPVRSLADYLLGRGGLAPDWSRVENLWFICRDLLGAADAEEQSALLCILAWIEWAKGRGSMSMALLRKVRFDQPNYRLAQLLEELLNRGAMPEWATDHSRAWRTQFS